MRLLLDTCVFLWLNSDANRLTTRARNAIENVDNELYLSALSIAEIGIKNTSLPMRMKIPIAKLTEQAWDEFNVLVGPLFDTAALELSRLPSIHKTRLTGC